MAKYSSEFKLHVVNEYLQGTLGYRLLAKKYHIPSKSQIETWVRQYKQTGRSGVQRKEKQEYTGEFKLNVLNDMKTTGASYSQTAIHFGLSEIGTIANWKADFLKDGAEAFFKSKGRPQNPMTKLKASKQPLSASIFLLTLVKITTRGIINTIIPTGIKIIPTS